MFKRLAREVWYRITGAEKITDEVAEPHYFVDSGYIAIGNNYEENQTRARSVNEQDSLKNMRELKFAHTLLVGVIAAILEDNNGRKVPESDKSISMRFALTAALMQGVFICERAILEGLYIQAGALIRQEYDALTALSQIRAGKRRDGTTPNAKHAPWKGSRHYGELSALAHMSSHEILDAIVGVNTSWGDFASTVPQYQMVNAATMYGRHTAYVLGLLDELRALYKDLYGYECSQREQEVIDNALSILVKHGVFKEPKDKNEALSTQGDETGSVSSVES